LACDKEGGDTLYIVLMVNFSEVVRIDLLY